MFQVWFFHQTWKVEIRDIATVQSKSKSKNWDCSQNHNPKSLVRIDDSQEVAPTQEVAWWTLKKIGLNFDHIWKCFQKQLQSRNQCPTFSRYHPTPSSLISGSGWGSENFGLERQGWGTSCWSFSTRNPSRTLAAFQKKNSPQVWFLKKKSFA